MNNHKQQFISSHGSIVYTDTQKGNPALILMHGLPTSKELWSPVLPHLSSQFRVVTFDLNDYGESEKIGQHITHQQRADVLDELRAHLGLEKFHLVAHDLGSSVAIDYMGKCANHVEKLVLMSPPVYPDFTEPFIVKLVRVPGLGELLVRLIKTLLFQIGLRRGMVHKERLTPEMLNAFAGAFSGAEGRAALLRILRWGRPHSVFKHYTQIIQSIAVPTLIIQGRHDPYIPDSQVTRLRNNIVISKLIFVEDGSHFLPIDTPRTIAREINTFIEDYDNYVNKTAL